MSLRKLSLTNFKRFRKLEIDLRDLTVLTGINGGGKTSILHSLILARQASAGAPPPDFVQLNGPQGLQLGESQDVLHRDAEPAEGIALTLEDNQNSTTTWHFGIEDERNLNLRVKERPTSPPSALANEARQFAYLGAERLGPRDVLGASSIAHRDLHVGHQGEFSAQVLSILERENVSAKRIHPVTESEGGATTLRKQTEFWLSSIVRPIELDAEWVPGSGVTLIRFREPGEPVDRIRPTNMGFGVSYALPIVTAALLAPPGSLLLVENPEAHLHPSGQSNMGSFLARIAADGVQTIIETHSDHLLNGIRRGIGVEKVLSSDNAIVHFFDSEDSGAARTTTIDLSPRGDLSTWPQGFFDQMDLDLADLARSRRHGPG
ncbi:AAA family ATPase [Corallococcus carmarthensis]|uniref:DUF3696 domain-containing protein n=1 Tax=Corallococcus carmarthensis TaxID=2316728 RepID=A0A3A8JRJ7_9BACT|nr:DUF3696 domain-containing protein [Corallococcus carmarthensis]RKG94954.1 DUF3696 domain-containing protein [Corallococcus carmarthensis]